MEMEISKLAYYMETQKPYTNPKLTLVELAQSLKMPPYLLSKVINNGFGKNFFDFINSYRIEEFKKRVEDPQFKNYTLLSIAFDVGFNSKTAFNRSFKKITSQTPSTYFNNMREY
jgi:AraC-like DNA-binding protein